MVGIRQFMGTMLQEMVRARVQADLASVGVAQQYLAHPFLKGFPVPAIHIKDVEVELTFALAGESMRGKLLQHAEVRENVLHHVLRSLDAVQSGSDISGFLDKDRQLAKRWQSERSGLAKRLDAELALATSREESATLVRSVLENFFFRVSDDGKHEVFVRLVSSPGQPQQNSPPAATDTLVSAADDCMTQLNVFESPDLEDVQILIEKGELNGVAPERLQKMKLRLTSQDKRWVVSQQDGQEVHTLSR